MLDELIKRDNAKISADRRDLLHDFFLYLDMPKETVAEVTDSLAAWIVENSQNFETFMRRREFETFCYMCAMNLPRGKEFCIKTAQPFCVNTWAKNKFEVITGKLKTHYELRIKCIAETGCEDCMTPAFADHPLMDFYKQFLTAFDRAEFLIEEKVCRLDKDVSFPTTKEDVFLHFIGTVSGTEILPVAGGFLYKLHGDSKNEYAPKVAYVRKYL